jgi:hypothetical protein
VFQAWYKGDYQLYLLKRLYPLRTLFTPYLHPLFMDNTPKAKRAQRGVDFIRVTMPATRADQLRKMAAEEGITVQALVAPILNSLAKGEVKHEYIVATPQPTQTGRAF